MREQETQGEGSNGKAGQAHPQHDGEPSIEHERRRNSMTESYIKQIVIDAVSSANHDCAGGANLLKVRNETILTVVAAAGLLGSISFFVMDSRIQTKTYDTDNRVTALEANGASIKESLSQLRLELRSMNETLRDYITTKAK